MGDQLLKVTIWKSSLFLRFFLIIIIPIILLQSITVFMFYHRHWKNVTETLLDTLLMEINVCIEEIVKQNPKTASQSLSLLIKLDKNYNLHIYDSSICDFADKKSATNKQSQTLDYCKKNAFIKNINLSETFNAKKHNVLFDRGLQQFHHKLIQLTQNKQISLQYLNYYDSERMVLCIFNLPNTDKKFLKGQNIQNFISSNIQTRQIAFLFTNKRIESSTTYIFVLWIVGVAIVLFIIAIIFIKNQLESILSLTIAAERISKGEEVLEFIPKGSKEIRGAGRAFLQMKHRLEKNIKNRTELLSHISHDLRTPVTRLKLQVALANIDEDLRVGMNKNLVEMERLLNSYLQFAKSEGNARTETFDVALVIEEIISSVVEKNTKIRFSCDAVNSVMMGRRIAIYRCLTNIVDNAIRHAKESVDIQLSCNDSMIYVTIEDDGEGMEILEDQDTMFQAFQKSKNDGYGLGLAIARSIVSAHGGDIRLYRADLGGLGAIIELPA